MDSYVLKHQFVGNQQKLIFICSVQTLEATLKICKEQFLIGTNDKKESREFMLLVYLDDDDDVIRVVWWIKNSFLW